MKKELSTKHRALIRELVSGASVKEAAERVGYTPMRVSQLLKTPAFQDELRSVQERVDQLFVAQEAEKQSIDYHRRTLEKEVGRSIHTLLELRDKGKSELVRQKSALEILDRAGLKATQRVEASVSVEVGEGVKDMLREAMQLGLLTQGCTSNTDVVTDVVKEREDGNAK